MWRPKVLPPRSAGRRRGVFSTRSPHRPNPIGLSVVRLDEVRGLTLHVRDVDMIDGTPVLDLKPYVPYADAFPDARTGWLEPLAGRRRGREPAAVDPEPGFAVTWSPLAAEQAAWLRARARRRPGGARQPGARAGPAAPPVPADQGRGRRLPPRGQGLAGALPGRGAGGDGRGDRGAATAPAQLAAAATPEAAVQRAFVDRFPGA